MTIQPAVHLLPANATPFEQALAASMRRISDIPAPLDLLWDPQRCPLTLLPWLAWALSVDVWDERWGEDKKRYVCAESFTLHRLKGTLEGIRRHLRLVDTGLVRAIVPPAKLYMGRSRTPAERRQYLARYPQIRLFPFRSQGTAGKRAFCTGAFGLPKSFFVDAVGKPATFPVASDAAARFGKRAILFEPRDSSETPLKWVSRETVTAERQAVAYDEIRIAGGRGLGVFPGKPVARSFFSGAKTGRIVSVKTDAAYADRREELSLRTISPGLTPIEINPEKTVVRGTRGRVQFCGVPLNGHFVKSTANERLYDNLYLFDPERRVSATGASQFIAGRFGMPAFTAEIKVAIRGKRSRRSSSRYMTGFLIPPDRTRLDAAISATRVSKAVRDTVLLNTRTRRPLRFGDGLHFGDGHTFGTLMRAH